MATRIEQLMDDIRQQIASRALTPGSRLPSVRARAQSAGVSVSTVVEAYDRLEAENIIVSRPGAGFFVSGPIAPLDLAQLGPQVERDIDPLWITRQALEATSDMLKPGCGWLPPDWMYEEGIRRALRKAARSESALLADYATPAGNPQLRQLLTRRLAGYGMSVKPEQLLLTDSGTHAIDLICRFFLEPGDSVLVDDPCYFNFHALLRAQRVNVIGVPWTAQGPDLDAFQQALTLHAPRLYITNSGIHNPTGATLSPTTAHRLLKMAEDSDLVIVEDDIFADLESSTAPRLAALDGLSRVMLIGSFSKTVSASVRCGFIAAKPAWVDKLTDLKIATGFSSGQLAADVLLNILKDSGYRRHIEAIKQRLADNRAEVISRLGQLGIRPWLVPQSGLFLWCELPEGMNAADVSRACLSQGVVLAPGNTFSQSGTCDRFLRFNVSQSNDERIYTVLKKVMSSGAINRTATYGRRNVNGP
ncbi:MAG: PLP-dependent aminotransferase family protein [Pantoea sp.]|uniref:aminotransferase-like domain-containing protein n=1 Tax=Pantoea sp. TaxID=69393 RepID=UPI0023A242F9|nr:PLP-dependent aminotransferase family protein [Pantoea sp.]MDE1186546.1 PLP-dependent aminotransferase family protein [Pantoea sp.]